MRRCPASLPPLLRPRYRGTLQFVQHRRPGSCDRWRHHGHLATNATLGGHGTPTKTDSEDRTIQKNPVSGVETEYTSDFLISGVIKCLPARYRSGSDETANDDVDPVDNAETLRQLIITGSVMTPKVDVLYELAVGRGQWKGAVWIVQQLLRSAKVETLLDDQLEGLVIKRDRGMLKTKNRPSLKELTDRIPPKNHRVDKMYRPSRHGESTLDAMLMPNELESSSNARSDHQVLGCVWRSLGMMVLACVRDESIAAGSVKPEVLEILALFHHHGLMPVTVYNYAPSDLSNVVQQPATLYLLSSYIMVALSDAAWRARESAALMDHQNTDPPRLELLSSAVRANIEAVRPEIWLELILWSCIHGGWIAPGADVLVATCQEEHPRWRALSWRNTLKDYLGIDHTASINWDQELTAFQLSREGKHDPEILHLAHTLSSELVSVFIEAIINLMTISKGRKLEQALQQLETLRQFLRSSDLNMPDSTWDAAILRVVDGHEKACTRTDILSGLVRLSAGFGEELGSWNHIDQQWRSSYMFEGNAAILGLLHRGLRRQIDLGYLSRAAEVLDLIRSFVDDFHKKSLEDFFRSRALNVDRSFSNSSKTNFGAVDHPNFEPQIPLSTLASFLDLSTQLGSYELGASLISDVDLGTVMLPEHSWGSPEIASSLIRFAIASQDNALLTKVMKARDAGLHKLADTTPSQTVMVNMLTETFVTRSWEASRSILSRISRIFGDSVDPHCLAVLAAEMLKLTQGSEDATAARALFANLTTSDSAFRSAMPKYADEAQNILKIMALIDRDCARLVDDRKVRPALYSPSVHNFNVILDAFAQSSGVSKAMVLLKSLSPIAWPDPSPPDIQKDTLTTLTGGQLYLRRPLRPNVATFAILLRAIVQRPSTKGSQAINDDTMQMVEYIVDSMFTVAQQTDQAAIDMIQMEVRRTLANANAAQFEHQIMAVLTRKESAASGV